MKKTLLFMGLLSAAASANAQVSPNLGPWVQVNTVNSGALAPGYRVVDIKTVSPTVSWALAEENSATGVANFFFRTNNATGDQFDFDAITAPGGVGAYETSNITAVSANTALAGKFPPVGVPGGGEILRTTNGGLSWTKVTNATQFSATGAFLDFVHMYDANVGIAVGDPTLGYFEIQRTTDGGANWTRVPQGSIPPLLNANEYSTVRSFFAKGDTLWFGSASSNDNDPVRVFKSVNRGLNWTASPITTLTGSISRLAFKDNNNGIAYNVKVNAARTDVIAVNLIRTADGGATWAPITPLNNGRGSFFRYDIDAVRGRYYSVGMRFPATSTQTAPDNNDFGSSHSIDGINWTYLNNRQGFFALDLIPGTGSAVAAGYAAAATDANGVGGIYKGTITAATLLATRDAALQSALSVYPNPSASGVFNVSLGSTLKGSAELTVTDALGRQVKAQTLSATAVGSKTFNLDLSSEKTGVYTLQIRTDAGLATQKIVIN